MNIGLRDCDDNMIFVGDTLSANNGDKYRVLLGYYHTENKDTAYGFYLLCEEYQTQHGMPNCNSNYMLKLRNESRQ